MVVEELETLLQNGRYLHVVSPQRLKILIESIDSFDLNRDEGKFLCYACYQVKETPAAYLAVKMLLERGADTNVRDNYPLWLAFAVKDRRLINLLIDHGAAVNKRVEPQLNLNAELLDKDHARKLAKNTLKRTLTPNEP